MESSASPQSSTRRPARAIGRMAAALLGTVLLTAACSSAPGPHTTGRSTAPGRTGPLATYPVAFCAHMHSLATTVAVVPTLPITAPPAAATVQTYRATLAAAAGQATAAVGSAPAAAAPALTHFATAATAVGQDPAVLQTLLGAGFTPTTDIAAVVRVSAPLSSSLSSVWTVVGKDCPSPPALPQVLPNLPASVDTGTTVPPAG